MRERVEEAAARWISSGRSEQHLLGRAELLEAERLLTCRGAVQIALGDSVRAFLAASQQLRQRAELARLRKHRAWLAVAAWIAIAFAAAAALLWRAKEREMGQARLAEAQARRATVFGEVRRLNDELLAARRFSNEAVANALQTQLAARQRELRDSEAALDRELPEALPSAKTADRRGRRYLDGHTGQVFGMSWSPLIGLVSASADGTARMWDANAGSVRRILKGHLSSVTDAAVSPDGRWIASASHDGTVRIWEAASGRELKALRGHTGRVWDVEFSPDGERVASASEDHTVRVWNLDTNKVEAVREPAPVFGVAFSPDARLLAAAGASGTVAAWDPATWLVRWRTVARPQWTWSVAFSQAGNWLAGSSFDGTVMLRSLQHEYEQHLVAKRDTQTGVVAFSGDGSMVATGGAHGAVSVWRTATGEKAWELDAHCGPVFGVAFSPDGRRIAGGCQDGRIVLFDLR
jgi:WD40 repeat protein